MLFLLIYAFMDLLFAWYSKSFYASNGYVTQIALISQLCLVVTTVTKLVHLKKTSEKTQPFQLHGLTRFSRYKLITLYLHHHKTSGTDFTAQKMKFSTKGFFSKCNQNRRKLRIWSHLLKKSLVANFTFCAVLQGRCS